MEDHALFDFTPNFCPDCGTSIKFFGPEAASVFSWVDFRTGIKQICPKCQLTYYFFRDLESVILRLQDEEKIMPSGEL